MNKPNQYNPHAIFEALGSEQEIELPAWGHMIGRSVYPLFIIDGGRAFPMGTAFLISAHGYIVTAAHTIFEGISREPRLAHLRNSIDMSGAVDLKDIGFAVLIHYPAPNGGFNAHLRGLENIGGAPPTDLVLGSIANFHDTVSEAPLILSPGMPSPGTPVVGVGYHGMPLGGISVAELKEDPESLLRNYGHRIRVSRGQVEATLISRVSTGFCNGPAFIANFEVYAGQSGGPVIGPTGVCGLISATATTLIGRPASFSSMLYPLLTTSVNKVIRLAPNFTINASMPMKQMVETDLVKTDGSEANLRIRQTKEGFFSLAPTIQLATHPSVFEDLQGYFNKSPARTQRISDPPLQNSGDSET